MVNYPSLITSKKNYADIVCYNMLKDLRVSAGLGDPPSIFTTNSSESINAVVKRKVNFKETEWPQFNQELKQIVNEMHEESIRALSGRGQYRLSKPYLHLQVDPNKWAKMTSEQRREHVKRFESAALRPHTINHPYSRFISHPGGNSDKTSESLICEALTSEPITSSPLSVSAEESGIHAFETIHSIWVKAEHYLKSERDIVSSPGSDKSMMAASKSSKVPHFVCAASDGEYACDNNCLQWKSSRICSHIISVAEKNHELSAFLQWYNGTNQGPNITTLATSGIPAGRGRKGGVPKRKRSASRKAPEIVVSRPAMQPSIENPLLQHPPPMVASPLPFWDRNLFSASNFPHSTTSMLQDGLSTPIFSIAQSVNSPNVSAIGSVISLSSTINSNVGSIISAPSAIVDSATTARHLASSNNLQPACNTNPFLYDSLWAT